MDVVFDDFEFGGSFIDIGLENVAEAAARVVELPPRCSNKYGQKRRCLQNACENHFVRDRGAVQARRWMTNP